MVTPSAVYLYIYIARYLPLLRPVSFAINSISSITVTLVLLNRSYLYTYSTFIASTSGAS